MSSTTLVPVEEYLRYSEKPNCEYRDGVVYPKPMPATFHGLLEFMLVAILRKLGAQAAPEVTVRLSPTKYLVGRMSSPPCRSTTPTLSIRSCSVVKYPRRSPRHHAGQVRGISCLGVPFCWVIDPIKRTAWEYHAAGEPVRATPTLRAGELAVSLEEPFSALDSVS